MDRYETLKVLFDLEKINWPELLELIKQPSYNLSSLGGSSQSRANKIKLLFPDKVNSTKICTYLLSKYGYKFCSKCNNVKELDRFSRNKTRSDRFNSYCKSCMTFYQEDYYPEYYLENKYKYIEAKIRYKLAIDKATPKWADTDKIKEIYKNCSKGYHVDHYYPLQGEAVCGLHVETNLQYLLAFDNISKSNKMPTKEIIPIRTDP